jgi:hypothetical protein
MRKTILAYILYCIEEMPNDFDLGGEIRQLRDTLITEYMREENPLLEVLIFYITAFSNDYQLGHEVRGIYKEINYYFDEHKDNTHPNSN